MENGIIKNVKWGKNAKYYFTSKVS
jgi:hypothetical protein